MIERLDSSTTVPSRRLEFGYLDGIRGIAALTVMVYHAFLFTGLTNAGKSQLAGIGRVVGYGYLGVPVFIVLSGYVLMLPVLRTPDLKIPAGFLRYIRRRGRRILPPYYAALLIVLALIVAIPALGSPAGTQWDTKLPVTPSGVLAHAFLLHDLRPDWIGKIDGPMWSVAVEWHIYFLMPLVLLPLWRRLNPLLIVAAAVVLTTVPPTLHLGPRPVLTEMNSTHVWLIGLFAAGMLSAQETLRGQRIPGLGVGVALSVGGLVVALALDPGLQQRPLASETLTGLVVALVLTWTGRRVLSGSRPLHVRFLECRVPMTLGLISYSVYLLHSPLLGLANLETLRFNLPVASQWAFLTFVAIPLDLAVCAVFYWLVERRFKNTRQRHATTELARDRHHLRLGSAEQPASAGQLAVDAPSD